MGRQFDLVELCILVGKVLHGIKSQGLLSGGYFTLLTGKSLKTKKDCYQSFLCCVALHSHSAKSPKDGDINRWLAMNQCSPSTETVIPTTTSVCSAMLIGW